MPHSIMHACWKRRFRSAYAQLPAGAWLHERAKFSEAVRGGVWVAVML